MYVIPAPLRPVMVFVHKDDQELAAGFQQNALQRVRAGDEAEIAFDGLPGQILKGKVKYVLDAIATGQFQATGVLQDMGADVPGGRAVAIIDITDDTSSYTMCFLKATNGVSDRRLGDPENRTSKTRNLHWIKVSFGEAGRSGA
jgi:hypothetical protein